VSEVLRNLSLVFRFLLSVFGENLFVIEVYLLVFTRKVHLFADHLSSSSEFARGGGTDISLALVEIIFAELMPLV
jgi:hypothetical protein